MLRLGHNKDISRTTIAGQSAIVVRGRTIPLGGLAEMLSGSPDYASPQTIGEDAHVVVVGHGDRHVGICVDAVDGEQEVVIKNMGPLLGEIPGISGASILGDGRVALIVDISRGIDTVIESTRALEGLNAEGLGLAVA